MFWQQAAICLYISWIDKPLVWHLQKNKRIPLKVRERRPFDIYAGGGGEHTITSEANFFPWDSGEANLKKK